VVTDVILRAAVLDNQGVWQRIASGFSSTHHPGSESAIRIEIKNFSFSSLLPDVQYGEKTSARVCDGARVCDVAIRIVGEYGTPRFFLSSFSRAL
jgi:hypothetical protein